MAQHDRLEGLLARFDRFGSGSAALAALQALVDAGLDDLPRPGHGNTLARWQVLARVGGCDLGLVKLFEGHTDALAILAELDAAAPPRGSTWGVWAADLPEARVMARPADPSRSPGHGSRVRLDGGKAWCSGAAGLSHALLTVRDHGGALHLAAVDLAASGISVDASVWKAVGMAGSASIDVRFSDVPATLVGNAGAYLDRAGFWQGGAGVAACWHGAAAAIGHRLQTDLARDNDPHFMAHLGAIDVALSAGQALLLATARLIDERPHDGNMLSALRARLYIDRMAREVLDHAARAVGAGPLCRDASFAQLMADLPVFIRQSHAERDLAALGAQVRTEGSMPWLL